MAVYTMDCTTLVRGPEPAVYSFDTKHKKGHLHPYSDNDWVYYGWHEGVIFD